MVSKHFSKEGHHEIHCWKLHLEIRPKKYNNKGKQKTTATTQHDLGEDSSDESKITAMGLKNMKGEIKTKPSTSTSNCNIHAPNEEDRIELFRVTSYPNILKLTHCLTVDHKQT